MSGLPLRILQIFLKFVSLPIDMKNVLTSLAAMLLVIWYSLSVIGFDVHTCSSSGESYVTTVIGGTTCEDIHPEPHKKACSCCRHCHASCHDVRAEETGKTDGAAMSTRPCCSDDWQMIVLTGCKAQEKQEHFHECHCGCCPCISDMYAVHTCPVMDVYGPLTFYNPDSGSLALLDVQRSYNIWRI